MHEWGKAKRMKRCHVPTAELAVWAQNEKDSLLGRLAQHRDPMKKSERIKGIATVIKQEKNGKDNYTNTQ